MTDPANSLGGPLPRRSVLLGALAFTVGGCTRSAPGDGAPTGPAGVQTPPNPTTGAGADRSDPGPAAGPAAGSISGPDARLLSDAVQAKRELLSRYDETRRKHPQLGTRLLPLATEHQAHLDALLESLPPGTPTAGTVTAAPVVPATAARALAALATVERTAARARLADIGLASAGLARLLAGIGAAEAAHAFLLGTAP